MGAWGLEAFENDAACDWMPYLTQKPDLAECRSALREFHTSIGWESGVAAAEVVAAAGGYPCPRFPEEIAAWLGNVPDPITADDVQHAVDVVDHALMSDISELWDDPSGWFEVMDSLRERLRLAGEAVGFSMR